MHGDRRIRGVEVDDMADVYRICAEVSALGDSAPQRLSAPDLAGDVFVGPYVARDPQLSWVVAEGRAIHGYIAATDDTSAFDTWRTRRMHAKYSALHLSSLTGADARYGRWVHTPPGDPWLSSRSFPAELHMKLLPSAQGGGWGRRLIESRSTRDSAPRREAVDHPCLGREEGMRIHTDGNPIERIGAARVRRTRPLSASGSLR